MPDLSKASLNLVVRRTLALACLAHARCAIDGAEACGEHQVYKRGGTALRYAVCVCDEADGYVFDEQRGYGCKRCAEGQSIVASRCMTPVSDAGADASDSAGEEPTGVGAYCDTDADCAGYDAKYCAVQTHGCLVKGCATGEGTCPSRAVCCDYSALLAGFSLCLPSEQLTDGQCPMGGTKVEP